MQIRNAMVLYALLSLAACGAGDGAKQTASAGPTPMTVDQVNSPKPPPIPSNSPIEPIGPLTLGEILVTDSWKPGFVEKVALIDREGPTLLVTNVQVAGGSWQVASPHSLLKYPATGNIMVKLSANQWTAVKAAKRLAVQPMPKTATTRVVTPSPESAAVAETP